ncbi:MAG: sigma-70 family RNA polymerase sigma factor [Acidiferrobacterales bacterium]|nr:sigma-70 family RNA polymerase sigma factor [Acidiferrobacterales bacterium]
MQSTTKQNEATESASIVARILEGDSQAEQDMVLRYQKGLNAMLYNRCSDKALSDDVAQETWVLVIQKIRGAELKDSRRLAGFIIQIAKNQLIMKFRARDRHAHSDQSEALEVEDQAYTPEQELINQQLAASVTRLLGELKKPRDRELIRRFYLVGDSKSILCEEYKLTEAHFDRVLYRARERFKELWSKQSSINSEDY